LAVVVAAFVVVGRGAVVVVVVGRGGGDVEVVVVVGTGSSDSPDPAAAARPSPPAATTVTSPVDRRWTIVELPTRSTTIAVRARAVSFHRRVTSINLVSAARPHDLSDSPPG
jgi:hypothetical protein